MVSQQYSRSGLSSSFYYQRPERIHNTLRSTKEVRILHLYFLSYYLFTPLGIMNSWTNIQKICFQKAPYQSCQHCTFLTAVKPIFISILITVPLLTAFLQYSKACLCSEWIKQVQVLQFPQNTCTAAMRLWQEHRIVISSALWWSFMTTGCYCFEYYGVNRGVVDMFQGNSTFHIMICFCYLGTASLLRLV